MPLISCPDCSQQVSDAALACPRCARPLSAALPTVHRKNPTLLGCKVVGALVALGGVVTGCGGISAFGYIAAGAGVLIFIVGRFGD